MPHPLRRSAAVVACLAATACATPAARVADREDLLAAAGFDVRPANTPERQASLNSLLPNHFVQQASGGALHYVYADPLVCNCLYVGDQQAYGRYRREVLQRRIADEQSMTAMMDQNDGWNGGPWGIGRF